MQREKIVVLINALIWGAVLIACAVALREPGTFQEIQHILGSGAAISVWVLILAVGIRRKRW
jgi:hypothetical protein